MNKLYISRIITFSILCCSLISGLCSVIAAPTGPIATDPFGGMNSEALTPEKLQEFESQLNAEIEDMVNKMDPKQKQIFDETVKRLEQKDPEDLQRFVMGDMNDAEMEDFLKSVIPEEAMAEEPEAAKEPQPVAEAPETEAPEPKFSSKHEKAKHLIETVIKHTQSFLDKTIDIPELENLVKQWKKSAGCMPAVSKQRSENWTLFKTDIEDKIVQKLHKLLDKDPKKDSYKYLDYFINNEKAYNNVSELRDLLVEQEPKIETLPFSSKELSKACQLPVQNVINAFGEALDELDIPTSLEIIFNKNEPIAKKQREEEQKVTDKALQASKQKPGSNPMRSVGSEPKNPYASSYNSGYSSPSWSGYSPSYAPSNSYSPSSSSDSSSSSSPFGGSSSGNKSGSGAAGKAPNVKDDKSDKDSSADKNSGNTGNTSDKTGKNANDSRGGQTGSGPYISGDREDSKTGIVGEIEEHIKNASDASNKLYKWTFTSDAVNSALLTDDLPTIMNELVEANAKVKQVEQNRSTSSATKRKLQSLWRIYNGSSTTAPMGIAKLADTIKEANKDKDKLDDIHKEAFFFTSDKTKKQIDQSIKGMSLTVDQIKKIRTVSLDDITEEISKLEKTISDLNTSSSTSSTNTNPAYQPRRSRV